MIRILISKVLKTFFDHQYIAENLIQKYLICRKNKKRVRLYKYRNKLVKKYGIFIGKETRIGKNLKIPHPTSIVIGNKVDIGNNCTIYQNVTIGKKRGDLSAADEYPIIKDNTTIFAGAVILGNIVIGENVIIAANSVVINDVEKNTVVGGVPAKVLSRHCN